MYVMENKHVCQFHTEGAATLKPREARVVWSLEIFLEGERSRAVGDELSAGLGICCLTLLNFDKLRETYLELANKGLVSKKVGLLGDFTVTFVD